MKTLSHRVSSLALLGFTIVGSGCAVGTGTVDSYDEPALRSSPRPSTDAVEPTASPVPASVVPGMAQARWVTIDGPGQSDSDATDGDDGRREAPPTVVVEEGTGDDAAAPTPPTPDVEVPIASDDGASEQAPRTAQDDANADESGAPATTSPRAFDTSTVLAWSPDEKRYGVAWIEKVGGESNLRFGTLSPDGLLLTDAALTTVGSARHPAIAWSDGAFGVSWIDDHAGHPTVWFQRIDESGRLLGRATVVARALEGASHPTLTEAVDGGWVIAWSDARYVSIVDGSDILAQRIGPGGVLVGPNARISRRPGPSTQPSIETVDGGYALAWAEGDSGDRIGHRIEWARLDASLNVRVHEQLSSPGVVAQYPNVEASGSSIAFAWREHGLRRHTLRVSIRGTDGRPFCAHMAVPTGPNLDTSSPGLTATGDGWLVAHVQTDATYSEDEIRVHALDARCAVTPFDRAVLDAPSDLTEGTTLVRGGSDVVVAWSREGRLEWTVY